MNYCVRSGRQVRAGRVYSHIEGSTGVCLSEPMGLGAGDFWVADELRAARVDY